MEGMYSLSESVILARIDALWPSTPVSDCIITTGAPGDTKRVV